MGNTSIRPYSGQANKALVISGIIFCLFSNVFAYSGGTGEPNDPYQIANVNDLLELAADTNDYNDCFILTNDIDLAGYSFTKAVIAPDINDSEPHFQGTYFTGVFDGNGYSILNLTIDASETGSPNLGLFGLIGQDGIVKNLGIEEVIITVGDSYPYDFVGALCGFNNYGSIINCYSTGSVAGDYGTGGLCGENSYGTITDSFSTAAVTGGNGTGGLCGSNVFGSIINCYSTGNVSGNGSTGGLCGYSYDSNISGCFSRGEVTGNGETGGLCGGSCYGIISNCYSIGNVNGNTDTGGLCGDNYYGSIANCYSTGNVAGTTSAGGLCGVNNNGNITDCYSTGNVSGNASVGGLCGSSSNGNFISSYFLDIAGPDNGLGQPLTCEQMKQQASFTGWDFVGESANGTDDIWMIYEDISYPLFAGQSVVAVPDVTGMTVTDAIDAITDANFVAGIIITEYSGTVPVGNVIESMPTTGTLMVKGSTVNIVVSLGIKYSGGAGTKRRPFQIATVPDWNNLMSDPNDWDKHFIMTTNINLQGVTLTPVGSSTTKFTGVFDGNNYIISNADMNLPDIDSVGLFGYMDLNGQVRNLGIEDVNITGYSWVGALVGSNKGSITDCYSTGAVSGSSYYAGGLVGFNDGGDITNCYSIDNVSGSEYVGGLVGSNRGSITNCYSAGTASSSSNYVGGLAGYNYGSIINCHSTGAVSSSRYYAGGLVGCSYRGSSITNCYSTGAVSATYTHVGGLVGSNVGGITNSYSTGTVSSGGGLCGDNYDIITSCYFLDTAGNDNGYGQPLTDEQMKQQASFIGWDFVGESANGTDDIWMIYEGLSCPLFAGRAVAAVPYVIGMTAADANTAIADANLIAATTTGYSNTVPIGNIIEQMPTAGTLVVQGSTVNIVVSLGAIYSGGDGTETNPYIIATISDWNELMHTSAHWNKHFIVTANINLQGITLTPVGSYTNKFTGIFDGKNHIISNADMNLPGTDCVGLFGYVGLYGQIRNLGIEDVNITGVNYVGGLCGWNRDIYVSVINIINCYSTGKVSGHDNVGGLVGSNKGGASNCYSTSIVSGSSRIGGLMGASYIGDITNCYSTGKVSGSSNYVGGLVGYNYNDSNIRNCYSTTVVDGNDYVGGLAGYVAGGAELVSSFWDVNSSGTTDGIGNIEPDLNGVTGLSTAEMQEMATYVDAGWDFSYIDGNDADWFIQIAEYPILVWQISPADIYTDGRNDFRDFSVFAQFWTRDDCAIYNYYCDWADLDFDGDVDIDDLAILMDYWLEKGIYN